MPCTPVAASDATSDKDTQQSRGFVAIRIYANTPDTEPHSWTGLAVTSAGGDKFNLDIKRSETRRTSKIFAGYLPQGHYRLRGLTGLRSNPEIGPGFEFDVRPGTLTNLGTLIFQPTGEGKATFVTFAKYGDLAGILPEEFRELAQGGADRKPLGWHRANSENVGTSGQEVASPMQAGITGAVIASIVNARNLTDKRADWADATDPARRLLISKGSTYSLNAVQELPNGELLAGSNLGQLLLRSKTGDWTNIDLDDPREVTALHARDRMVLNAGGEEGMLKQSTDGGKTWTDLGAPVKFGLVLHLAEVNGELFVLSVADGRVYLHSRLNVHGAGWNELKNLPSEGVAGYARMTSRGTINDGKYSIVIPGKEIHSFDLTKKTWAMSALPKEVDDVRSNGQSIYSNSFTFKPQHSTDAGATWNKVANPCRGWISIVVDFAMLNPHDAWAVCMHSGAFAGSTSIRKSSDGGRSWSELVKETPLIVTQFVATNTVLLYIDRDTKIYSSRDGGISWNRDRRPFN